MLKNDLKMEVEKRNALVNLCKGKGRLWKIDCVEGKRKQRNVYCLPLRKKIGQFFERLSKAVSSFKNYTISIVWDGGIKSGGMGV